MTMHLWCRRLLSVIAVLLALGIGSFGGLASASAEEESLISSLSDAALSEGISDYIELESPVATAAYMIEDAQAAAPAEDAEQDPWEPFNEAMFSFNHDVLDRFVVKPLATAWDRVLPDPAQRSLRNAIDNLDVVRRVVNNLLQAKFEGAGREVARFTINSIFGVGGLFDVAKEGVGIEQSDEDTGQTFGVWGIGPGPYLVLPFLPVTTVRDGIGSIIDTALNPLNYVFPFVVGVNGVTTGIAFVNGVNERSMYLDTFERVEETVVDLYSAVRNGYLQRRAAAIKE